MLSTLIYFSAAVALCSASQIGVLHKPPYVKLTQESLSIALSEVQSHLQYLMGFTVINGMEDFHPLGHTTLFRRPKALVVIEIDGLDLLPFTTTNWPLVEDSEDADLSLLFTSVRRVYERESLLVDYDGSISDETAFSVDESDSSNSHVSRDTEADAAIVLQDAELLTSRNGVKWSLTSNATPDAGFLLEMRRLLLLCQRISKLKRLDDAPDVFAFRVRAFSALISHYDGNSAQTQDAVHILRFILVKMVDAFRGVYDSNVLVLCLGVSGNTVKSSTSSETMTLQNRVKRDVGLSEQTVEAPAINLAPAYSEEYAAMFNLSFWTIAGIVLAVMLVSWLTVTMDPGYDSVIYRLVQLPHKKRKHH